MKKIGVKERGDKLRANRSRFVGARRVPNIIATISAV